MRLEILMTVVLFYGLAFLMGYAVRRLLKLKNEGILFSVLSGVMCMWALMELVLVPMTMKFASFTGFVYVWTAVAAVAAAAGLSAGRIFWRMCGHWQQTGSLLSHRGIWLRWR